MHHPSRPTPQIFGLTRLIADSSRARSLIRSVRCSCVIRPPFARRAPGERLEHRKAGAPPADFDVSFPRRLVDFDSGVPLRDGVCRTKGQPGVVVTWNVASPRSVQDGFLPISGVWLQGL
jgi:hypothetical protein